MNGTRRPPLLARRSTDEYDAPAESPSDAEVSAAVLEFAHTAAARRSSTLAGYLADRAGTAATLRAIDAAAGGGYYDVPEEAALDSEAAAETFAGDETIIDVQTHYVARDRTRSSGADGVLEFIRSVAPDRFRGLDRDVDLSFSEYLRCVYLESETACAVLTAAPGDDEHSILTNAEIRGTRELLDRFAGTGRMLHHAIVHPDAPGELDRLEARIDGLRPNGLKVYTLFGSPGSAAGRRGWMLDDDEVGLPFLERARALGVRRICAHKGLSSLAPTGSPADIGPAAAAHPDLDFLVYHSGYEVATPNSEEGPFDEERSGDPAAAVGSDRLVATLRRAGIAPGGNVFAELGSTWYLLLRRPREAAHVLGKLLVAVGEDNLLWGTDSVWYGPCQPLIDAFRRFRIPVELCERYGYPELTAERKAKILGANAARVYDLDASELRARVAADDLAWIRGALSEATLRGLVG